MKGPVLATLMERAFRVAPHLPRSCIVEETRDHALILLDPEGRFVSWHQGAE